MTEEEWLASTDPRPLLDALSDARPGRQLLGNRKLRLLACATCRLLWDELGDEHRQLIATTEEYADGKVGRDALAAAYAATFVVDPHPYGRRTFDPRDIVLIVAKKITMYISHGSAVMGVAKGRPQLSVPLAQFTRDVYGPILYRRPSLDIGWITSTATGLAEAIYADRAFDRLPVLADVLEEAGCDDADILAHCRGPGPHVRGCWVVDLVLGKS